MEPEAIPDDGVEISVVVPVYNSAKTLGDLYRRLVAVLDSLPGAWELVLVNDGSADRSWERLQELSRADPRVVSINLSGNFGQHNALMCGLRSSSGRYVVTMDDDLQHPPEEIPKLVKQVEETGAQAVLGSYGAKRHSPVRNAGSWLAKQAFFYAAGIPRSLRMTSFRLIRRSVVDRIGEHQSVRPRIGLILFSITKDIEAVETEHHARAEGRSGYSLARLVGDFADNILYDSPQVLRRVLYAGALAAVGTGLAIRLVVPLSPTS